MTPDNGFVTKAPEKIVDQVNGMIRSAEENKPNYLLTRRGPMFARWTALLGRGAAIYGEDNWWLATKATDTKGRDETKRRFLKSAARHFEQWLAGERDEDHAAAVFFNVNGYEAMLATDPPKGITLGDVNDAYRRGLAW